MNATPFWMYNTDTSHLMGYNFVSFNYIKIKFKKFMELMELMEPND